MPYIHQFTTEFDIGPEVLPVAWGVATPYEFLLWTVELVNDTAGSVTVQVADADLTPLIPTQVIPAFQMVTYKAVEKGRRVNGLSWKATGVVVGYVRGARAN